MGNLDHKLEEILARTGLARHTLAGQVAVITGAGRGIGFEAARALAWLGSRVVIAEFDQESGQQAERAILAQGRQALFVQTDVSSEEGVTALAETTHAIFGPVDILVNNAIQIAVAPVAEMDVALWDRIVAVNLRGTFLTCKAFLLDMLPRQRGVMVNMISAEAMPGLAAYIATKQGIAGFTQSLALEVGDRGIRAVPFAPGMVDTPGLRSAAAGLAPRLGMPVDQFLNLSLHPAYEGLMPAEHAGVATAYLIAALADEYHGEIVTGYTVLERAGLISAVESKGGPLEPGLDGWHTADRLRSETVASPANAPLPALDLVQGLSQAIAQTGEEFSQLPVFVRPLARSGFKAKSGQSLQDWARTAERLEEQIGRIQEGEATARRALAAEYPRLREWLEKLATYFQDVPAETARFTKDRAVLQQVEMLSQRRVDLVQALIKALEAELADK